MLKTSPERGFFVFVFFCEFAKKQPGKLRIRNFWFNDFVNYHDASIVFDPA